METAKKQVKKSFATLLIIVLNSFICGLDAYGYSGGSGTEVDPYQIATKADLLQLADTVEDYNKCFILTSNINMGGQVWTTPIIYAARFNGQFDGNDYKITNFTINGGSIQFVGLFSRIDNDGSVINLGLENFAVSGSLWVGGLSGDSRGSISNCYATGSVSSSDDYVGGLVGSNHGTISNCYSTGSVEGDGSVGGLVGSNGGSISGCYATGAVRGRGAVGGLVGSNGGTISGCHATGTVSSAGSGNFATIGGLLGYNGGTISGCYATGSVSGASGSENVGGLVGFNRGNISNCCSTSTVSGSLGVGGLVGYNFSDGALSNCYSTGNVSGSSYVGGLVGENRTGGIISNCYSRGTVSGGRGLVGYNYNAEGYNNVYSCFWDIETSGQTTSFGGRGLTTSQMKSKIIYQNAGWAGKGWVINDGLDYPRLTWENTSGTPIPEPQPVPLSGSGTEQDPYQVWTAEDFAILIWHVAVPDKHIALMANLDLTEIVLYPIGDLWPFTGVFEGNGYVIRNIEIRGAGYIGLFGYVSTSGQIHNLGIADVNMTGGDYVGGLAGFSKGSISNCYSTGAVRGSSYVGGLVGINYYGSISDCYGKVFTSGRYSDVGGLAGYNYYGSISNCYATGNVARDDYAYTYADDFGGLVGSNGGTISNCYSKGTVSSSYGVGGLAGDNGGTISNCYATGLVSGRYNATNVGGLAGYNASSISSCYATGMVSGSENAGGLVGRNDGSVSISFWDIETSGRLSSAGGEGKTTAEMKTLSTFTLAGWDFVDIWSICEGTNYPRLLWQIPLGDFVCPDGVSIEDLDYFVQRWLLGDCASSNNCGGADINGSGAVDFADFAMFAENWLIDCGTEPNNPACVPE